MSAIPPHLRKIRKLKRHGSISETENLVAKSLYDLELHHKTLRQHLPRFHFNTAKVVQRGADDKKKALVVLYPLRYFMLVRKVQKALTSELEKKFSGHIALFIAQRTIKKRPTDVYKLQSVQRSQTSTAVFENILNDMLHPSDIVGQRVKCRVDGSKVKKVFLDTRDRKRIEPRLPIIAHVYRQLTHRTISFGFMWNPKLQQVSNR